VTVSRWSAAVDPATTDIACGAERHEVRWEDGHLVLPAHVDVEAERALGALGGEVPPCLRLRAAWTAHERDPVLVTLGRRPGEPGLGFAPADGPSVATFLHTPPLRRRPTTSTPAAASRRDDLVLLLSLPVAFIDRLALTAMAAAAEQWPDPTFREVHGLRLGAALAARATPALRRLGEEVATPDEAVLVHCTPSPPGGRAALRAQRTGRGLEVTASLPLEWLSRVWGPGLSEPDGRFVLSRRRAYGVDVVEWEPTGEGRWDGTRRPAELVRDDEAAPWRVRFADR
jgi:hypothetical protein